MYDYTNGMLLLHVQTETTCIPFVYSKNKLYNTKFKKEKKEMWPITSMKFYPAKNKNETMS